MKMIQPYQRDVAGCMWAESRDLKAVEFDSKSATLQGYKVKEGTVVRQHRTYGRVEYKSKTFISKSVPVCSFYEVHK
jgi:hypothetical protein